MKYIFIIPRLDLVGQAEQAIALIRKLNIARHVLVITQTPIRNIHELSDLNIINVSKNWYKKTKIFRYFLIYLGYFYVIHSKKPHFIVSFGESANALSYFIPINTKKIFALRENRIERNKSNYNDRVLSVLYDWVGRLIRKSNHSVTVQTNSYSEMLSKSEGLLLNRVVITPNLYDVPPIPTVRKNTEFSLCIISRVAPEKNILFSLQVFKRISAIYPSVRLEILGGYEEGHQLYYENCIKYVSTNKINVEFRGYVSNPWHDCRKYSMLIFPSLWEGYPSSLVRSLLNGVAVAASDCSSNKEIMTMGGIQKYGETSSLGLLLPIPQFNAPLSAIEEYILVWSKKIIEYHKNYYFNNTNFLKFCKSQNEQSIKNWRFLLDA